MALSAKAAQPECEDNYKIEGHKNSSELIANLLFSVKEKFECKLTIKENEVYHLLGTRLDGLSSCLRV